MNRAQRRQAARDRARDLKHGGPGKLGAIANQPGVEVDVVEDGVIASFHHGRATTSIRWSFFEAKEVAKLIAAAAEGSDKVQDVELASGIVVAKEMPT